MDSNDRLASLLANEPYKRFIKATISRVSVKVLDPISMTATEIILSGDPKKEEVGTILDLWTPIEFTYFERNNRIILEEGLLVEFSKSIKPVASVNSITDDDIRAALSEKFFTIKNMLGNFTSPAPVQRILEIAEEMDKPVKTIEAIKARLSDLQAKQYEGN